MTDMGESVLDQVAGGVWVRQHTHTADSELIRSLGDLDEVLGDRLLGAQTPRPLGLPVPTGRVSNTRPELRINNPVHDAMGDVEAFRHLQEGAR